MGRSGEMEEYIKEFRIDRMEIKRKYMENKCLQLETSLKEKIKLLIDEQVQRQREGSSGKIKFLFLCRLMSSGYTESYESLIGLSNNMLYLDEKKSTTLWYPQVIYENIALDVLENEKLLRKKFIQIEESELFLLKQKLLFDDWILLQEYFTSSIKKLFYLITESHLRLEDEILILCGDYMDNMRIVWHRNTKEGDSYE